MSKFYSLIFRRVARNIHLASVYGFGQRNTHEYLFVYAVNSNNVQQRLDFIHFVTSRFYVQVRVTMRKISTWYNAISLQ